ncbi:hypothetical protein H257_16490 [Aphanomyces astaci]|uniref:Uncharacterized protein n=1 Tax=Aphanomyces astaci TaxID=112090 RepID=W4FIA4_APHAT|nr:hypothetical protein H257_16490 [Aphanomyces astaci]ETV67247.1 hypothetical protein H257_16490 [Aphanomyces astaci]|eukprot:XP_009843235.1 hypothetical protein H257_16490 [Aphanomyces astaci]
MDTPAEHDTSETVADTDGCQHGLQRTAVSACGSPDRPTVQPIQRPQHHRRNGACCHPAHTLLFPIQHWLPSPTDTAWTHRLDMTPTDVNTDYRIPLYSTISHWPGAHMPIPYSIHGISNVDRGHGTAKKFAIYNILVNLTLQPPTAHRNYRSLSTRPPTISSTLYNLLDCDSPHANLSTTLGVSSPLRLTRRNHNSKPVGFDKSQCTPHTNEGPTD